MKKNKITFHIIIFIIITLSIASSNNKDANNSELKVNTNLEKEEYPYYYGGWPFNPNKDKIKGANIPIECPFNISCECQTNKDCINKYPNLYTEIS